MDYAELGRTGIRISRIIIGTAFRSGADDATCVAAMQEAETLGCNILDCANIYREGYSEQVVGKFLRDRRDRFILTTKVGAGADGGPLPSGGLSRDAIMQCVDRSLARLHTDYIDLYLCHFPDPVTPIDQTLRAMDDLVKQGKIRHCGCSNFDAPLLRRALDVSERDGLVRFACDEVKFGLLDREIEAELAGVAHEQGVSVTVFAATSIGLLSGRYRYGEPPPPGTSWHRGPYNYGKAMTPRTGRVIDAVISIAEQCGRTPGQVAMAWCLTRPGITSVITGADTPQRVRENCGAVGWALSIEHLETLDRVSQGPALDVAKDCPDGYRSTPV